MAAAVSGEVEASTLASEKPTDEVVPAEETKAEEPVEEPVKEKKSKVTKEKKPKKAKGSHASHPPYFQMIKEALLALKDNSGSSAYAIAKFMEEKHRAVLPANFKKILWLQLKNCTAKGKLIKIKASFKLSELGKKGAAAKTTSTASKPVSKPRAAKTTTPKKPEGVAKGTGKKVTGKRSRRSAPAKPKQPKSIKSPAAKKAKKVAG